MIPMDEENHVNIYINNINNENNNINNEQSSIIGKKKSLKMGRFHCHHSGADLKLNFTPWNSGRDAKTACTTALSMKSSRAYGSHLNALPPES